MKNLFTCFSHNKYRLTIFGLLAGATLVAVVLVRLRIIGTDSLHYVFLVWNLFLAWST